MYQMDMLETIFCLVVWQLLQQKEESETAEVHEETQMQQEKRERDRALKIAEQLQEAPLKFKVKAGETGRLYGSITSADVAQKVGHLLGMEFDKRWLKMDHSIRDVGKHMVDVKLQGGVHGQAQVIVESES